MRVRRDMRRGAARGVALGLLLWSALALAQAPPQPTQQCVATAIAGGTADALTVPRLPCAPTTTIVALQTIFANTTTSPTLQVVGDAALPIVEQGGQALGVGELQPSQWNLLIGTGTKWVKLSPTWPNGAAYVQSDAALAATPTTLFPLGLWRANFVAGDGTPTLFFLPQTGTCVTNGMVNDGGSCRDGPGGQSWKAVQPTAGIDIREFGMASTATAAVNLAACKNASSVAFSSGLPLIFGGGSVPITAGCDVYAKQVVDFRSDSCLVMEGDGAALGTRAAPSAVLGAVNGDDITFRHLCVDMARHHGVGLINRAGMHLEVHNLTFSRPLAGSWTDLGGGVSDTGTTTDGSGTITDLMTLVGRQGMKVTDSKGCIPADTQVASNDDGTNSLGMTSVTTTGCGALDVLTFYPVLPDGGIAVEGLYGVQGAYYARIWNPDVRVTADTTVSAYSGGSSFDVSDAAGIAPAVAHTITGASWSGGIETIQTADDHQIARGQLVCVIGVTTTAYNQCNVAGSATYGNVISLTGVTSDPGPATIGGGKVYSGGSLVIDGDDPLRLANATIVTAVSGNTVTILDLAELGPQAGFGVGDSVSFTTGGIGFDFWGTDQKFNPNAGEVLGGKMMGFAVGQLNYQGNNTLAKSPDYTLSGYGVVLGGSGYGTSSPGTALQDTVEGLWAEYQMLGTAVYMTSDSVGSCAGGCGYNIASFSSAVPAPNTSRLEIVDQGLNNRGQVLPLGWINHQTRTPVWTCGGGGAVVGYTAPQLEDFSQVDSWAIVSIELQTSGAGTCAGPYSIQLPLASTARSRQPCSVVDFTSGATLAAWEASGSVVFAAAPVLTDRILLQCIYTVK